VQSEQEMFEYVSQKPSAITGDASMLMDDLVRQSDLGYILLGIPVVINTLPSAVFRKVELENEVRRVLERGEFSFALQPQIEIASGKLFRFEIITRWLHCERGFIAPDEFIPLIENTENMLKLDCLGLKKAFEISRKFD
jgi:sensor c-di-GMP phosphodiesterase-like protein